MGYIDENLVAGERVLYRTRLHWIVVIAPLIFGAFLAVLGLTFLVGGVVDLAKARSAGFAGVGLLVMLLGAAVFVLGLWYRNSTEMAITNRRLIIKTGLLTRNSIELMLAKVESVSINQGLTGRMLGYGSIVVRGSGGTAEPFSKIANPLEFRRQVQQQIENAQEQARAAAPSNR
ncbi:MAG: PH domain-containing protein [Acidobacteriales bacterium]|nr:PH domain-containing protein [Terriglobales bacterium]